MKTCKCCKKSKDISEFYEMRTGKNGNVYYFSNCKSCHSSSVMKRLKEREIDPTPKKIGRPRKYNTTKEYKLAQKKIRKKMSDEKKRNRREYMRQYEQRRQEKERQEKAKKTQVCSKCGQTKCLPEFRIGNMGRYSDRCNACKVPREKKQTRVSEPITFLSSSVSIDNDIQPVMYINYITGSITASLEIPDSGRKRRSDTSANRMYWTPETNVAIVCYNSSTCDEDRNRIYNTYIHTPLQKLVENVYNTFKFSYHEAGPLVAQQECLSHLASNLGKFDHTKRNKLGQLVNAFSYFSIIAKNYLILSNNSNYKRQMIHDSLDAPIGGYEDDMHGETHYTAHVPDALIEESEQDKFKHSELNNAIVKYFEPRLTKMFHKANEIQVAGAILTLMRQSDSVDMFNKKALYLYIREMALCKTQNITRVITKMKKYVFAVAKQYMDHGEVNEDSIFVDVKENVGGEWTRKSNYYRICPTCKKKICYSTKEAVRAAKNRNTRCRYCKKR